MPQYITRRTLRRLSIDVTELERRLRQQSAIVRQTIESGGGTHDNAMYDAALHEQAVLAQKLERLQHYLRDPVIIEDVQAASDLVTVGKIIVLENNDTGIRSQYVLLGPADIEYEVPDAISHLSPLAKQLLGKRKGDSVKIIVPSGKYDAEIIDVLPYEGLGGDE
jgi:transcription elongation factor GreA